MPTRRIFRTHQANTDIENAVVYFAERDPDVAERFYAALKDTEALLLERPLIGASRTYNQPQLADMRMFRISDFENYLVFYRQITDGIEVVRVLHGARDIHAEFDDRLG